MKLLAILSVFVPAAAFVAPSLTRSKMRIRLFDQPQPVSGTQANSVDSDNKNQFLNDVQHEWQEQSEHLRQHEKSFLNDPDLAGLVREEDHHKKPNPVFRDKESHRHDSLGHEVEHAIDNDPYLKEITAAGKQQHHQVNPSFRDQELHRHDSLLDEIQHAIEEDPDLKA